jgi:hypothetical protein
MPLFYILSAVPVVVRGVILRSSKTPCKILTRKPRCYVLAWMQIIPPSRIQPTRSHSAARALEELDRFAAENRLNLQSVGGGLSEVVIVGHDVSVPRLTVNYFDTVDPRV